MFSTPETSVHVRDENREISPLEREEGYGGKDLATGFGDRCFQCACSCAAVKQTSFFAPIAGHDIKTVQFTRQLKSL